MELKAYSNNKRICVVNYIQVYMQKVEPLRLDNRTNVETFLISYRQVHRAVGTSTIAKWTVKVMKQSGDDVETLKAHSTKSAITSARKNLAPMDTTDEWWLGFP